MNLKIAIGLFDLLLVYLLFGQLLTRKLMSRRQRLRSDWKEAIHHLKHHLRVNRDILKPAHLAKLEEEAVKAEAWMTSAETERAEAALADFHGRWNQLVPPRSAPQLREYLEILVVAFALAFGVRSLFLQPFKIPTGSMQPTLFGIHSTMLNASQTPTIPKQIWDYLHYSRRYVHCVIEADGNLEKLGPARPAIPLFPSTVVQIGGIEYRLPGSREHVMQYCPKIANYLRGYLPGTGEPLSFKAGDVLADGYVELGDHLFVDRVRFNFTEPRRGDIMVFLTDGIQDTDGSALNGRYYIKRLVGMPGDILQIRDHRLYIKSPPGNRFEPVNGGDAIAFNRLASYTGGYRGYCHFPSSVYLTDDNATYTVGPDQYFMLGDNSENSKDSRFWGPVPRSNLLGRAAFTWWPFSRRWGPVDRVGPEPFPSPPTMN